MKNRFRAVVLIIIIITILLFITSCISDNLSKEQIFALVNGNEELLNDLLVEIEMGKNNITWLKVMELKGIKEISITEKIVEFSCGGSGFGSSTSYYGFYYSKDDDMTAIWCAGEKSKLTQEGKGWIWKELNGDNSYYTEKIIGHYYYYEAHF